MVKSYCTVFDVLIEKLDKLESQEDLTCDFTCLCVSKLDFFV